MEIQSGRVISPGRVNLLGEHVDYNDGLVLPAAIDRAVRIKFTRRNDHIFSLSAHDLGQACEFSLQTLESKVDLDGKPLPSWALYPAGVVWNLTRRGYKVNGFNGEYSSDIPIGAGLSSSAAVEVGFGVVCQVLGGWNMDRLTLARYCQQAENEYVGVNCGLMDQFACANGIEGHAVLLDTRSLEFKPIPLPPDTKIVIADSTIRRSLLGSEYNDRRRDCETAVKFYQSLYPDVQSLRDLSLEKFLAHSDQLSPEVYRHARHVVEEIERVNQAITALGSGDAQEFGRLMFETHKSLRDLYEVSCSELDAMVEIARSIEGCYGARLTGAGFGGCTVNLVKSDQCDPFVDSLSAAYFHLTGLIPNVFITHASEGTRLVSSSSYPAKLNSEPRTVYAIEAHSLNKTFRVRHGFWKRTIKTTVAVEDVSFNVNRGELFGLLGPNGAGKTTTVKMLSTLLIPTRGSISIFGLDSARDTLEIRKRIGFAFGGARGLYGRLTAVDNLRYFAELYAIPPEVSRKRIPELLETVGLTGRGDDRVETFSSGMTQRLHLARALLHDPELIFLDEPTVGIDPVGARELRCTVKQLIEKGKTILLTTHYMAEADELCDRIAIINKGRLIALDTPSSLKKLVSKDSMIEVKVIAENLGSVRKLLSKIEDQIEAVYSENTYIKGVFIRTERPGKVIELLSPLLSANIIQSLEVRNQTLEDVYVSLIKGETE